MTIANWFTCFCTKLIMFSLGISHLKVTSHERHCAPNHWQHQCLFNRFLRITTKKISKLRITGPLWKKTGGFLHKEPVMRKVVPWHDVIRRRICSWWSGIRCFDNPYAEAWRNRPPWWQHFQTYFSWSLFLMVVLTQSHNWLTYVSY